MAKFVDGAILDGSSGKLFTNGRLCMRYINGKSVICKVGKRTAPMTESQLAVQAKFKEAIALARADLADAEKRAYWEGLASSSAKYSTALGVAMSHYFALQGENGAGE